MGLEKSEKITRAAWVALLSLAIWTAAGHVDAATEVKYAVSPDKKWEIIMKPAEFRCQVSIRNRNNGKVVTTFDIDEFAADNVRDTITANWRKDSAAVALNITRGRSASECEVFVFGNNEWKRLAFPTNELEKVRQRNNEEGGKSQDYLTFDSWSSDGVKLTYQGNKGSVEDIECRIVSGAQPELKINKTYSEGQEVQAEAKSDYENYVFTLLAGGTQGSKDGKGAAAQFKWPHGLSRDSAGNLFVADRGNNLIRKIDSSGLVTTLAGSAGNFGASDGMDGAARFKYPIATAVSATGIVYVADSSNNSIRRIAPDGMVSSLTVSGSGGYADGIVRVAQFMYPVGITIDTSGSLYVADSNNRVIRKIADGRVTTMAGSPGQQGTEDGNRRTARFFFPASVAVDSQGNVYVADNSAVRKIDNRGQVSSFAGLTGQPGNTDGAGTTARLSHPVSLAISAARNIFVADDGNNNIRKITPAGVVKTIRDVSGQNPFTKPVSVVVDDKEQIYVADEERCSVLVGKPAN